MTDPYRYIRERIADYMRERRIQRAYKRLQARTYDGTIEERREAWNAFVAEHTQRTTSAVTRMEKRMFR